MLSTLQIENYALIEQVSIEFGAGFNVLTGETGSGKSIIVDALGVLLGERAEAGAIRSGAALATVTGSFDSPFATPAAWTKWWEENGMSAPEFEPGGELRLRREVGNGRSRAFVDHQLATLGVVRQLARRLGEIHSQNEALVSFTPAAQLRLLDRFAGHEAQVEQAAAAFAAWREASERRREGAARERQRLQEADVWRFQAEEIDAARPLPNEDAALEQERLKLANAERIAAAAQAAYDCLYDAPAAAVAQLKSALRHLSELQRFDSAIEPLSQRLESARAEAADVAEQIRGLGEKVEAAPGRLEQLEQRLATLDRLRRKYGPALGDVIRHRTELAAKLDQVDNAAAIAAADAAAEQAASAAFRHAAAGLAERRRAAAARLGKKLEAEVADLAMTLRFEVAFEGASGDQPEANWSAAGWDRIRFLASTNPGEPLKPVQEIASGGELSRLLLALHLVAEERGKARAGTQSLKKTLVLDEVDAGIGGRAAEAVGRKMQQLGRHYQVLCVTHLAQIATFAAHHVHVEKTESGGRTRTLVKSLQGEDRVAEVARMLAGNDQNPTSRRHAKELLTANGTFPP